MKIYTKTGDKGETSLYDGTRVRKDSVRVESYGTVDELNSHLGFASHFVEDDDVRDKLFRVQKKLFFVAGELATKEEGKFKNGVTDEDIQALERWIDEYLTKIEKVDSFIIPGSSKGSAALHVARTVCRRAERRILALAREDDVRPTVIKFVNRLSDTVYAFARYLESDLTKVDFEEMGKETL
ncbi:MAG: cob(I)yrinic acid a,c-diamide adenosyltransferase [Peptostreptococcaceae bacterium]|nr:cob(I)yrinic acid a,c-diamide adenosyltransferase [Peptostreptococcaceae bacterium]